MSKIDQLIAVFKEVKEDLNKNMNGRMNPGDHKPNATTGTSGGQGGMYRSEDMKKQTMNPSAGGAQDMNMIKFEKNGQWRMDKMDEPHKDDPHHEAKEKKIAKDIKTKAKKLENMHKTDELADAIVEKLEKACSMKKEDSFVARDGKNREANPKLKASDLGPGGKVHMIKEEDAEKCDGTNSEAASSKPHNKGKFKVMPMEPEKSVKHLETTGLPYSGKDKDVKKDDDETKKSQMGHIQGNEAKGNDENKAPGRGTLTV